MKKVLLFMGMIIALTLTACSNDSTEAVVEQPEQTGEFADIPLTAQQKKKVPVLNDFALKLARQMAVENKSFVVSPLSVAFLLGMLDEGAVIFKNDDIHTIKWYVNVKGNTGDAYRCEVDGREYPIDKDPVYSYRERHYKDPKGKLAKDFWHYLVAQITIEVKE